MKILESFLLFSSYSQSKRRGPALRDHKYDDEGSNKEHEENLKSDNRKPLKNMTVDFPGINALIPENADQRKWAPIKSRKETARKVLQETGPVLIHPYNVGRVISGQGTIALELLEQAPQIDIDLQGCNPNWT